MCKVLPLGSGFVKCEESYTGGVCEVTDDARAQVRDKTPGEAAAYREGLHEGDVLGFDEGWDEGWLEGEKSGYTHGYSDGAQESEAGYDHGFDEGMIFGAGLMYGLKLGGRA